MQIVEQHTRIDLDLDEISVISYALLHDLKSSVENHWKMFPNRFKKDSNMRINLMLRFFDVLGRGDQGRYELAEMEKFLSREKEKGG